ncbi:uncharacterized protein FIESC28_01357 [Fusarium coffeatum]|uniref:Uncharacterized protein n=1 Tax=Fusarium coffeatum TaxID=231269 RepID=A0A366S977_9HYPO|nr:uncharacterized protein FIESC28_01357 [Fusarium coffeatum]RBR25864.1 hypothetical protein FIESC28_01357 [Fusarium coffeatum]
MPPSSTSHSLVSEVIFASSYREGAAKCIGHAKSKSRCCKRSISQANVKEHDNHMKFRHAVSEEARKKKEEETEKFIQDQREAGKNEDGVIRSPTPCAPHSPYSPPTLPTSQSPYGHPALQAHPAPATPPATPPATLRITDECPSESDSDSDSDSDSEEQGTGTVDPWTAYQARWKDIIDNGVKNGIPLEYQMPWPVVSGHFADVNHLQIRAFFERISADMDSLQIGRMLYHELMRWERSGIRKRFGRSFYMGYKSELKVIQAVVHECAADFWI